MPFQRDHERRDLLGVGAIGCMIYLHKNLYRLVTTIIDTKLAIICANVANSGRISALGPCIFIGTNTSDPGSGLGSLV